MKLPVFSLMVVLSSASLETAFAVTYKDLSRSDLGISYLVPQNAKAEDLKSIKAALVKKRGEKSYFQHQKRPAFKPVPNPYTARPTVIGRMTLHAADPNGDYTTPITGVPHSCSDVRARKAEADELLRIMDRTITDLDDLLASIDFSTATPELIQRALTAIANSYQIMVQTWAQLQDSFPVKFSQEKYHLQYVWTYPFNQVCKGITQRTTDPQFTDLSMPGLIWSASSGQQLGDFLQIVQVPQYELSRVSFVKEVSLASACLDDQSLEIQGKVQAETSADCAFGGTNGFLLKAGTPNPMETPGAFSEQRLESLSCPSLFADLKAWSSKPASLVAYPLGFQLSSLKLRLKSPPETSGSYAGYMSGLLHWNGSIWSYRGPKSFSDRQDASQPQQLFARSKADDVSVQINPSGTVSIILHTWGNHSFDLKDIQCLHDPFASYIRGWQMEDHGPSLWTLSLHPLQSKKYLIKEPLDIDIKPWKGELK